MQFLNRRDPGSSTSRLTFNYQNQPPHSAQGLAHHFVSAYIPVDDFHMTPNRQQLHNVSATIGSVQDTHNAHMQSSECRTLCQYHGRQ